MAQQEKQELQELIANLTARLGEAEAGAASEFLQEQLKRAKEDLAELQ